MYAYLENNKWYRTNLSSNFKGIGAFHTLTDAERAVHSFYPCITVNEGYDVATQKRSELPEKWEFADGVVTATYGITELSATEIAENAINKFTKITNDCIQARVTAYNKANGTSFDNIHNVESYSRKVGYTHQVWCLQAWNWNVEVWEAVRAYQIANSTTIPTDEEFQVVLDSAVF